jgi:hypothetical protein
MKGRKGAYFRVTQSNQTPATAMESKHSNSCSLPDQRRVYTLTLYASGPNGHGAAIEQIGCHAARAIVGWVLGNEASVATAVSFNMVFDNGEISPSHRHGSGGLSVAGRCWVDGQP